MNPSPSSLSKLLVTVALTAVRLATAQAGEKSQNICPFEPVYGKWRGLYGFESAGLCYTLVKRAEEDLQASTEMLDRRCKIMFKGGKLFYFDEGALPETLNWYPNKPNFTIMNSTSQDKWNAYLCVHQKYRCCLMSKQVECVYLEELNGCYWQETMRVHQHEEMPYGRPCLNKTEWTRTAEACVCSNCMDTAWTQWSPYTDQRGLQVRTRYRPFSHDPTWPCAFDSSKCCYEVDTSNLGVGNPEDLAKRVSCARGGTKRINREGWKCLCPLGLTGMYCEIDYNDCEENECENNSTCQDLRADYKCICTPNTTGKLCETLLLHGVQRLDVLDIVPMVLNMPLPGILVGIMLILFTLAILKITLEKVLSRNKKVEGAMELSEAWKRKFSKSRGGKEGKHEETKSTKTGSEYETTRSSLANEQRSFDLESSETSEVTVHSEDKKKEKIETDRSYSLSSDTTSNLHSAITKEQGFPAERKKMTTTAVSLKTESRTAD